MEVIEVKRNIRKPKTNLRSITYNDGRIYLFIRSDSKKPIWHCRLKFRGVKGFEPYSTGETDEYQARKFADNLYEKRLGQIAAGIDVKSKPVAELLSQFVSWVESNEPDGDSREPKLSVLRRWIPFFKKLRIKEVSTATLSELNDWSGKSSRRGKLSPSTIKRRQSYQRQFFSWCQERGYINAIPKFPKLRVEHTRRPHFDEPDYKKLYECFAAFTNVENGRVERARTLLVNYVLILANTGIRVGEARGLKWRDIKQIQISDGDVAKPGIALHVRGKTGARDAVATHDNVRKYLKRILEMRIREMGREPSQDEFVFCHPDGKPIGSFRKSFESLVKFAGVQRSSHDEKRVIYSLRHTYATFRLMSGVDCYPLSKNMGTSVKMVETYYGHTTNIGAAAELTKGGKRGKGREVGVGWLLGSAA